MSRAFDYAAAQPWLMLPEMLDTLLSIADRQANPEALEARLGHKLENTRSVSVRDGVAVIPVTGPIMRYANLFTRISGATSTQELATDLQAALDDPGVKAIVLNMDTPGGEASGINELADMVYAARGKKPIKAYVGGTAASAGFWIASAADEVVIDDTALIGSIGVVVEVAVRDAADGEKRYTITSSNAPNKRPDLGSEEGRAQISKPIDALANVFVSKVARNLNLDPAEVPAKGDHGGLLVGAQAVKAGLAHRIGSLESLITELAASAKSAKPATTMRKLSMTTVKTTADLQAALAAGIDPQSIEIEAAAPVDVEAVKAEEIAAERARIQGINALACAGFEEETAQAIEQGLSVEASALLMFNAARDRGISIAAIKKDSTGAAVAVPSTTAPDASAAWGRTMKKLGA